MNNSRFATALHILTLLAIEKDKILSSEYIAGSININPVLVRKEISNLRSRGFIESKEGKNGGYFLAKRTKLIKLSSIFKTVNPSSVLGRFNETNPHCPVGNQINYHINKINLEAETALIKTLENKTLADFCRSFI